MTNRNQFLLAVLLFIAAMFILDQYSPDVKIYKSTTGCCEIIVTNTMVRYVDYRDDVTDQTEYTTNNERESIINEYQEWCYHVH